MKGKRITRWISLMISAMLVLTLFPMNALAEDGGVPLDPSEPTPTPTPVTITILHKVTFVDWDNSVIRVVEVAHGESAVAPTHPDRMGFVANGWDKDFSNVVDDMTVTALYRLDDKGVLTIKGATTMATAEAITYKITINFFDKDGSPLKSYSDDTITQAQRDSLVGKSGVTFVNALAAIFEVNFLEMVPFDSSAFTGNGSDLKLWGGGPNYTVNAHLNKTFHPSYEIRYVSTSGATVRTSTTGTGDMGQTITGTATAVTGYNLPAVTTQTMVLKATGNVITFVYTPITYNITYNLGGGVASGNPATYTIETPTFTLNNPTREGYTFLAWNPTDVTIEKGTTGPLSFTASWTPILYDYEIRFVSTSGVAVKATTTGTGTLGQTITGTATAVTGYNLPAVTTQTMVLKATDNVITFVYTPITYNITYNLGGGGASGNPDTYTVETPTFTLNTPTREHYTFASWDPADVTIEKGTTGPLTFTASWTPITYSIKYILNGGAEVAGNPTSYTPDSPEIVLLPTSRDGYTFSGWSDGGKIPAGSSGDKTFTASWTPITYSIKYILNGGAEVAGNPTSYTPDDPEIVLLPTSRDGYTFAGWSDDGILPAGSTGDKTFTASWTPITYSIKYILNGGAEVAGNPTSYTPDDPEIVLLPTTRDGYTFAGWSDGGKILAGSVGDKTFTASWTPLTYSITYVMNGGVNNAGNPKTFTPDSPEIILLNPTRTGYAFAGWTPEGKIPTGTTVPQTFTASWTASAYNITYNLNGGTNAVGNPTTYSFDSPRITLLPATKVGYTFTGWSPNNGVIQTGSSGDKTFSASWKATSYRIYYNLNGGANSLSNPYTYTIESPDITLKAPTRIGYDFTGWTPDGGVILKGSTGEKTFAANWSPKVYNLSYVMNGGTNNPANPATYTIESPDIVLATPTKPGYSFIGWFWGILPVSKIPTGTVGNWTLTAVWSPIPITYDITYELNGGTNADSNPKHYWVTSGKITLASPTRTGYTFNGWSPNNGVIPAGSTGDRTFTASWTPITYNIVYILNGGAVSGNPSTYTVETPTFMLNTPSRDYYTFDKWSPSDTVTKGTTGDLKFTASWKPIGYTITYNLNDGTNADGNPDSFTVETPTFTLDEPTRDYYTFDGWTPTDTVEQGTHEDLTFTANWKPVVYDIKYDLAGGINAGTNPASYTVETPDFTIADPTRAGYDFLGWTPADTKIETGSHGDLKFTAKWSDPIVYNIVYELGGGINAATNPATYTVETDTITLAPPTRAGYNFVAWTPEGTIAKGTTGSLIFTATWSDPIVYPITYVMNGGVNSGANPATYTVVTPAITLAAPTRAGYDFTGWTPAGGIPLGSTGAKTFTATWSAPIDYDITYTLNGGVNAAANPATYNVTSGLITLADPTRTGYDFLGWTPAGVIPAGSTGDLAFTARWSEPHVHTVTYFVTGGTQAGLDGATPFAVYENVAYGAPVPIPDDPAQAEFTFDGWTSDIPATMPDDDVVLYGTLTRLPVLQEIVPNEKTPLAGPTWSLLSLIFAALTALGMGSIVNMLLRKRNGASSRNNTMFSLSTLIPAIAAIVVFLTTEKLSGSMIFADSGTILQGVFLLLQSVLVALGFKKA